MLRNRMLILLGGCVLTASATWADDLGYVDCRNHPDETQVFGKARQSHETVASLPCGERFTVLLYGFIFSRIQTRDGKVGYVYSNLISVDRSGAPVPQPTSTRLPAATSNVPATTAKVAQPNPTAPAQPQATPAQPAPTQAPAATSYPSDTAATVVEAGPATPIQSQPAPTQPAPIQAPATTASVPETPATVAQPEPTPARQPDPVPADPAAPAIRSATARESWEKPNAGLRTAGIRRMPLIELFGGYGLARLEGGGGTASNLHGALGSVGWNVTSWLQIVADSSYNVVTAAGTKNVLYGNHYGPRLFRHGRNRWGVTPFAEALVGGSRADTTVSGAGGYKTSDSSFSIKVGGGLDIRASRYIKVRLFDVDYYRTSFGPNLHQNNYWASTGIVLRLFGGGSE
jgi:hypothetical protein